MPKGYLAGEASEPIFCQMARKLIRALRLIWSQAPLPAAATLTLTLGQGVLPLVSLYYLKLAIDLLSTTRGGAYEAVGARLGWLIALSGVFYLLHLAVRLLSTYTGEVLSLRVMEETQELIARKSNRVELGFYEDPEYFDTLHQAQREAPERLNRLIHGVSQALQGIFSFSAIGALLLYSTHWSVAFLALLITGPAVLFRMRNARQLYEWQRGQTGTERQVSYYEWLLSSTGAAKESRLFNLGNLFAERASSLRRALRAQRLAFTRRRLAGDGVSQSAAALVATGLVAYMAFQALKGLSSVGSIVMNYQAFQRGIGALHELAAGISSIYESNLFISRLFQFLDLPEPTQRAESSHRFPRVLRHGIEFHDVSFSYRQSDTRVLDGVNFRIEPGQMVALVGENGAGKSTLIKLLCGLYEPTNGRITVDGIDVREFDRRELWDAISVLFQDYGQYFVSAEENIWFGDISRPRHGERLREATRQSGADAVIADLPNGYAQQLGTLFDGGQELSLGQWQKIALARTFFREAPIIILDEPSSALDVRAEHDVFEKFKQLTKGRTSIVISHRLSTVRMADRIFLLDGGRLAETGTHSELVSGGGIYADLFETQASSYR